MAMCRIQDHGKDNLTDGKQEVNKPSGQEHTISGSAIIRYHRLLHRQCASLDLETAFKHIKISQDIMPVLSADLKSAYAQYSCQECCVPLHYQRLPKLILTTKKYSNWW